MSNTFDKSNVLEFRPFEDPEELMKIRQERERLIKSLGDFKIPEDEKRFILRKISIISEKLLQSARFKKDLT